MDVTLLGISIGNTRTRIGAFIDGKLEQSQVLINANLAQFAPAILAAFAPMREEKTAVVVLASVNPNLTEKVIGIVEETLGAEIEIFRVEEEIEIPIGRQVERETIVGDDRLLNAAAAYDVLKQAVVVVDAGTAIVIDFVDGAGVFHGGAIGPGAQLMLDSLHQRTAQLPEVTLAKPTEPVGHDTREAMLCGVYFGLRGMVRELVEQYAEVAGAFPMVVATGGNAELLFEGFDLVDRIVPDLTLRGLAVTLQSARDGEKITEDEE